MHSMHAPPASQGRRQELRVMYACLIRPKARVLQVCVVHALVCRRISQFQVCTAFRLLEYSGHMPKCVEQVALVLCHAYHQCIQQAKQEAENRRQHVQLGNGFGLVRQTIPG